MKKINSLMLVAVMLTGLCMSGLKTQAYNVTFQVNMFGLNISPDGIHIAGNWQNWDPSSTPMTLLSGTVYTYTVDLEPGQVYQYKYINGAAWGQDEYPPAECGIDNLVGGFNRYFTMPEQDTVLPVVCFGLCIDCAVISGVVSYDNNLNTPLFAAVHLMNESNEEVAVVNTDMLGRYSFSGLSDGIYTLQVTCDMPIGGINAADALKVTKHFVGLESLTGLPLLAAEVNGEPTVNAVDAEQILKAYTGILSSFALSPWIFESPQFTFTYPNHVDQDIKGICRGDVTRSYVPMP